MSVRVDLSPYQRLIALAANYRERAAHNAWVLINEASRFSEAKRKNYLPQHLENCLPPSWIVALTARDAKRKAQEHLAKDSK